MPKGLIALACAGYSLALILELIQLFWPRSVQRLVGLGFGALGLLAQGIYLAIYPPALASQDGSILFLSWVLAVFYFYGAIHHGRLAWAVFVLPLVLGLIFLGQLAQAPSQGETTWQRVVESLRGERFWGMVHGGLLILSAVGVCVAFVASVMYLFQSRRLKAKQMPSQGVRLLSLERLEEMNRRGIVLSFPLLTAGVLVGAVQLMQKADGLRGWSDPRILYTVALWLVFGLLLYLRYGVRLRGRRVALLTILAFPLLLVALLCAHTAAGGGNPP